MVGRAVLCTPLGFRDAVGANNPAELAEWSEQVAERSDELAKILGAWDGDPDRHIISYQTAIGQALLGHEGGETVSLNSEDGAAQFSIVSIRPAPPDRTEPAADLATESAVETAVAE